MSKPAARTGDMHTCPMVSPGPVPHVGGPIAPAGCPTVLIGGMPAARVGDMAVCVGPPDTIAMGSLTVLIGGMPAARMGDPTAHGGVITMGLPTVLIGDGAGGQSATMSAARLAGAAFTKMGCDLHSAASTAPSVLAADGFSAGDITKGARNLLSRLSGKAQSIFDSFKTKSEKYADGVTISGSWLYRRRTRAALNKLKKTPSGRQILDRLAEQGRGGKGVVIQYGGRAVSECSSVGPGSPHPGKILTDPITNRKTVLPEDRGSGTGSTVSFDPTFSPKLKNKSRLPAATILGHELLHGVHNGDGTNLHHEVDNSDPKGTDNYEEAQTIGRGAYRGESPSENSLRKEMMGKRYVERTSHYGF